MAEPEVAPELRLGLELEVPADCARAGVGQVVLVSVLVPKEVHQSETLLAKITLVHNVAAPVRVGLLLESLLFEGGGGSLEGELGCR